jgi:uncharacterized tellurite resistance protein B-like protein
MNFKKAASNFTNNVTKMLGIQSTYQVQVTLKVNQKVIGVFVINADGINERQAQSRAEAFVKENYAIATNVLKKLSTKEVKAEKKRLETIVVNQ